MRTTVAYLKNKTRLAKSLGLCPSDSRVLEYLNEAQQRLMSRGRWWGTYQRAVFCVTDGCLTMPREVANIESVAVCKTPIQIRNQWYEFLENVAYVQNDCNGDSCNPKLYDRGMVCTFSDLSGSGNVLHVYPSHSSDVGKRILIQGTDHNGQWVRLNYGGTWIDGEYVTLAMPFAASATRFKTVTGIQKEVTNTSVLLYEYNATSGNSTAIGVYQPDEETPEYRRVFIPALEDTCCCSSTSTCCDTDSDVKTVDVIVKLAFIPAVNDTDYVVIGNPAALIDECQAVKKFQDNLPDEGYFYERRAINELNHELRTMTGDKVAIGVAVHGSAHLNRVMGGFI